MNRQLRRRTIQVFLLAALLYIGECAYMWGTQKSHIFEPTHVLQTTPDRMGVKYEELDIPSGKGEDKGELDAWWIPADNPENAPTMLYLHGNDRNISNNLENTLRLHKMGYNVFLPDYRGYGKSSGGKPSESKVYEDAESAWQYLVKWRGLDPHKTFIYGHSLGGAIAIDLAIHHPEAAGLVTESTFTSMKAMGEINYGYLPVGVLLNQRFASLKKIPALNIPLLIIHGTWDQRVPVEMGKRLYAAAPEPKKLLLIEGGEHSNSSAIGWVEYRDAMADFVKRYMK